SRSTVRFDGVLRVASLPHVPFAITGEHNRRQSGQTETRIDNRLSTAIGRASVTNTLSWQLADAGDTIDRTLDGTLLVGGRISDVRLRGQVTYGLKPLDGIRNTAVTADWRINHRFNARAGFERDLTDDGVTTYSAGVNTQFKLAAIGLNVDYKNDNELNARVNMAFSLGYDSQAHRLNMTSTNIAEGGALTTRVFLDNNMNGKFDKDDTPLKNVGFMINERELMPRTDGEGLAFVTGLDTYRSVDFGVSHGSLENPFWLPQPKMVNVVLRPGVTGHLDIPVITTGEIDGTVYLKESAWAREAADVQVQLRDEKDRVVRTVKSSYDGFYLFDYVKPGTYTVRADPEQMARLKIKGPNPRKVVIQGNGTIKNGMNLILLRGEAGKIKGTFRVKLTSFITPDAAKNAWEILTRKHPRLVKDLTPEIQPTKAGNNQEAIYSLYASNLKTRDAGTDLCKNLRHEYGHGWCNPIEVQAQ
ncbi:MAG: hypothetical protein RIB59_15490, partial [Rhodospirillales bacterium]